MNAKKQVKELEKQLRKDPASVVVRLRLAGALVIASGLDAKVISAVRSVSESFGLQVLGAVEKPLTVKSTRMASEELHGRAARTSVERAWTP